MNPIPKTKADELDQKINKLFLDAGKSNRLTNDVVWLNCMKEVEKLKSIHEFAAEAYAREAALFALKADREKSFAAFKNAIRLNSSSTLILLNYVNCALMLGKPTLAAKKIAELSEQVDGNPKIIRILFDNSVRCGMFKTAEKMLSKLEKLNKTELSSISHAIDAFAFLNKHQFNEQDIVDRLDVASNIVFELSSMPLYVSNICTTHAGLMYEFFLSSPVDKIVEINRAIDDALNKQFNDPLDDLISFSTTSFV